MTAKVFAVAAVNMWRDFGLDIGGPDSWSEV